MCFSKPDIKKESAEQPQFTVNLRKVERPENGRSQQNGAENPYNVQEGCQNTCTRQYTVWVKRKSRRTPVKRDTFCELWKRSTFTSVSILVLFVSTFILLLRYVFWVFVLCQKYHLNLTSWGQLRQTGNLESLSKHEVTNTEPVESEANPFFVHNLRQSEHKVTSRETEYEMRGKNGTNGITDTNTEATSGRGSVSSQVSNDSCVSTTSVCTNNFARGWSTSSSSYSNGFKSVKAPQDWFLIL